MWAGPRRKQEGHRIESARLALDEKKVARSILDSDLGRKGLPISKRLRHVPNVRTLREDNRRSFASASHRPPKPSSDAAPLGVLLQFLRGLRFGRRLAFFLGVFLFHLLAPLRQPLADLRFLAASGRLVEPLPPQLVRQVLLRHVIPR